METRAQALMRFNALVLEFRTMERKGISASEYNDFTYRITDMRKRWGITLEENNKAHDMAELKLRGLEK
jgi:hypothetical protein